MSVKFEGGRARSYLEIEEEWGVFEEDLEGLSPQEIQAFMEVVRQGGDDALAELRGPIYHRPMIGVEEFLDDEYYLGHIGKTLYPYWRETLIELFEGGDYHEAVFGGAIGIGKNCQSFWTLIPSSRGMLSIEQLVKDGSGFDVRSDMSREANVYKVHDVGEQPTVEVTTKRGYVNEGRPNHRIRVLHEGHITWRRLDEVQVGDVALLERGGRLWGDDDRVCEAESECIGAWTGDGMFREAGLRGQKSWAVEWSLGCRKKKYVSHLVGLLNSIGWGVSAVQGRTTNFYSVHRKAFVKRWQSFGCVSGSHNKVIPDAILRSPEPVVCAFIRGLFDTDGTVGMCVEFTTVSWTLAYQVHCVLLNLGVTASRTFKDNEYSGAWTVRIVGKASRAIFMDKIGFKHEGKAERARVILDHKQTTWRFNDTDVLYGMHSQIQAAWDALPLPRKPHRSLFASKLGKQNITRTTAWKIRELMESRGARCPAVLEEILDRDLVTLPVEKTEDKRSHCYDLSVRGDESYVAGGFLSHNTAAGIAMCYMLYQMSCIKDPQAMFGLEKNSDISFVCLSVREDLARKVVFGSIKSKVMTSKYFMDCFPYKQTLRELRFPHNIQVAASASSMSSALSLNTFGGILDEVNFMPMTPPRVQAIRYGSRKRERTSHAETLYNMVVKRIKSRYLRHGKVPGILMLLSSKSHTDAFTEKRVAAGTNNPGVMIRETAIWNVKRWAYSDETFPVLAGNERIKSEVLADEKMAETMRAQIERSPDHEGCIVIDVPVDFRHDFETDIDTALQDLAGIATVSISPFLQRPEALYECIDETRHHPMVMEWCPTDDPQIEWDLLVQRYNQRDASGVIIERQWGPIVNPDIPRHVHIDTSLNKDATGIAIVHQYDWATRTKRHPGGDLYEEEAPVYYVDLMLRVVPPPGEDIIMADVRSLLYSFMDKGYHFAHLSTDQYQSVEMRQHFEEQRGVETSLQSMDKTLDPYLELRSAIYENRIIFYKYPPFMREISRVIHDKVKGKIDHIESEQKDVADAIAGAVFTIMDMGDTQPIPMRLGIVESGEEDSPDEWLRESLERKGKKAVQVLKSDPDDDFVFPTLG